MIQQGSFDATLSKCMPPLLKYTHWH